MTTRAVNNLGHVINEWRECGRRGSKACDDLRRAAGRMPSDPPGVCGRSTCRAPWSGALRCRHCKVEAVTF